MVHPVLVDCDALHPPAVFAPLPATWRSHPAAPPAVASDASPVGGASAASLDNYVQRLLQSSVFAGLRGAGAGEGAALESRFGGAAGDKAASGGLAGFGGDLTNSQAAAARGSKLAA